MNFSVVIPNLNGAKLLQSSLESIQKAIKNCPHSKFEIILIDNGSVDDSVEIFKKYSNKYKVLKSNHGFAQAVNVGINISSYEWIAVLNNDLKLDQNWFKNISKTNIHPNTATICGSVLNNDGTRFESQGLHFFYSGKAKNINNKIKFSQNLINKPPEIVWGASGAATVYNKKIIEKIGKFDETFFAYEEDVDLSFRINSAGYQTLLIPNCLSYHQGGATSNKMGNFRSYHDTKNWHYIIIKNYSLKQIFLNFPAIFFERLKNLKYLIQNTKPVYKIPFTLAILYVEIARNIPKLLKKRKVIQKLLK